MNARHINQLLILSTLIGILPGYLHAALFEPAPGIPVEPASGVLLADMNQDRHLDLVIYQTNQTVIVRFGDGKGQFAASTKSVSRLPYTLGTAALGDLNKDGKPDLIGMSKEGEKELLRIFLGDRDGSFAEATHSPYTINTAIAFYKPIVRLADLNADGNLDVVTGNGRRNDVEVFLGDGRGVLSAKPLLKLESDRWNYTFHVADVDGDNHPDLITASSLSRTNFGPAHLHILRGNGQGGFAKVAGAPLEVPADAGIAAVADLNRDHRTDLVLTHGNTNLLSILLNNGQGGFKMGPPITLGTTGFTVATNDINRDTHTDLVVITTASRAAPYESKFEVLLGNGRDGFAPATGSPLAVEPGTYHFVMGDMNEDGRPDIIAKHFGGSSLNLLLGR